MKAMLHCRRTGRRSYPRSSSGLAAHGADQPKKPLFHCLCPAESVRIGRLNGHLASVSETLLMHHCRSAVELIESAPAERQQLNWASIILTFLF